MNIHVKKRDIAFLIFVFINFAFSVKYFERYTSHFVTFSMLLSFFYLLVYRTLRSELSKNFNKPFLTLVLLLLFSLGSLLVLSKIKVETLNVDRWSIISGFWDSFFSGKYAYFGKGHTGNPPGPMPFYFILALPFYLIGEVGLFSLIGLFLFIYFLKRIHTPNETIFLSLILLSSSIFFLWEIVSRSNVFTNSALVVFLIYYILNIKVFNLKNLVLISIFIGLLMSTRNVFVLPFCVTFIYLLKTSKLNFKEIIFIGICSFLFFALTFTPFVIGHFDEFLKVNPFIVQSSYLIPFEYTIGFTVMAIILGFMSKTRFDVIFYGGLSLFLSIVIYFIFHIYHSGFVETFFNSKADISYFIFCIPFFVLSMLNTKKKDYGNNPQ